MCIEKDKWIYICLAALIAITARTSGQHMRGYRQNGSIKTGLLKNANGDPLGHVNKILGH